MTRSGSDDVFVSRVGWALTLLGLGYAGICIAARVGSAWPLEWMEGASALHAQRLLRGAPLYAAPHADFIPFVYPPLSYLPMGLGLIVSSGALWGARLASLCGVLACGVALWRAASRVGRSRAAGLTALGLFALGYGYTGGFIDLARVDAWFSALCLWGVERLCARRFMSGFLMLALACLAKQHAFLLLVAASVGVVLLRERAALRAVGLSWLALGAAIAALCAWSDGWIWTYCVTVPARHGIEPRLLVSFVFVDLLLYLPVVSALCGYFVATRRDPASRLLCLLLLSAIAASALGRAHPGGDDNVRLPAYALGVLVAALGFHELVAVRPRLRWPLTAALALQLAMLLQPPGLYWPSSKSDEAFARLSSELERCAGSNDFVAMDHSGLGDRPFAHTLALSDLRMNRDALAHQATTVILDALRAPTGPKALAISNSFPELMQTIAEHYELCARTPPLPLPTGYQIPEAFIYRRKPRP